jgi:uncharacterized protein (TIGR02757 family)
LKPILDRLYVEYDHAESAADPVHIARRFQTRDDREVAAFLSSALAFGRVASVLQSVEGLLAVMGESPAGYVHAFEPRRDLAALDHLVHRWTRGVDFAGLLWILRRMLEEAGSIEAFFLLHHDTGAADVGPGLESFSLRARAIDLRPAYGRVPARPGAHYFFSQPSCGSACKRLNLFMRWMVRCDAIDMGIWSGVRPSALVVPLDTHVIRVGQCLGLTRYQTPGWRMAAEITAALRQLDPDDPVKYDFSLCHVGMTSGCGFNRPQGDSRCPLRGVCRPTARKGRASRGPSVRR